MTVHLLNFVTTVVITRHISPTDFGMFSLLLSFSFTLFYVSSVGLPEAVVFFLGKRKEPLERIVGLSLFLFLCCGLSVGVISYAFKDHLFKSFLRELPRNYFAPLIVLYGLTLLDGFLLSVVRGMQKYLLFNGRRLLTAAANFLGVCIVLLVFGLGVKSVIAVFVAVSVVSTAWFFSKVGSITAFRFRLSWTTIKSFLSYGFKSYAQILAGHLVYQIDVYIISYFLGAKELAFYSIAVTVATLLWYIPNTIGTVLFPTLTSIEKEGDANALSAAICRNALFVTTLGAIVIGLIGPHLVRFFYGDSYTQSVNAMLLILPGVVAMSVYKVLTRSFASRNRQQVSLAVAIASLLLNVCLNLIWIPRLGIEGASLSSSVSYSLAGTLLVIAFKVESGLPFRKLLVVSRQDLANSLDAYSRLRRLGFLRLAPIGDASICKTNNERNESIGPDCPRH